MRRRGLLRAQEVQVLLPGGLQAAGIAGGQVPSRRRLEEQRRAAQVRRNSGRDTDRGNARGDDDDREHLDDESFTPVDNAGAE